MERVYVYDANGYTGKYYGLDSDMERGSALNKALDRMVDQETLEIGGANLEGYLYPVYSADCAEGAERGYVAAADSPGYRHVTWEVHSDETSPEA